MDKKIYCLKHEGEFLTLYEYCGHDEFGYEETKYKLVHETSTDNVPWFTYDLETAISVANEDSYSGISIKTPRNKYAGDCEILECELVTTPKSQ